MTLLRPLRVKTLKKNEPMQAKNWNHRQWVNETDPDPDTLRAFYESYIELSSCNLEFYQEFLKLTKEL